MASSIAAILAPTEYHPCWRSAWTQSAFSSSAAEFMSMPKPGRSRGPNLGSERRLRLAHKTLEGSSGPVAWPPS
eukprot:4183736-Alexandrium_andersonii.AAC.1